MKRDDLTKLKMSGEQIDAVMAINGKDIERHKDIIEKQLGAINQLKSELNETGNKLFKMESEQIDSMVQANAVADKKVYDFCFEHTLNERLKQHQVKDVKAVKAHLNFEELKYNEESGEILGLENQIDTVKANKAFLFDETDFMPTFCTSAQGATKIRPAQNSEANSAIRAFFGKDY